MLKRSPLLLWLVLGILFLAGCSPDSGSQIVEFADPSLEEAVRAQLEIPAGELTGADLEMLDELKCLGREITGLSGLEHAVNIRYLNLRRNMISDLAPLSGLEHLETLVLDDNMIKDLAPLGNLTGLRRLQLTVNLVEDISVVEWENFEQLEHLDIRFNKLNLSDQELMVTINTLIDGGVEVLY